MLDQALPPEEFSESSPWGLQEVRRCPLPPTFPHNLLLPHPTHPNDPPAAGCQKLAAASFYSVLWWSSTQCWPVSRILLWLLFCRTRAKGNHTTAVLCLRSGIVPFNRFPLKGSLLENPTLFYFHNQKIPSPLLSFPQKQPVLKKKKFPSPVAAFKSHLFD